MTRGITIALVLAALGCESTSPPLDASAPSDAAASGLEITPGEGIGPVRVGMRYDEVRRALGPLEGAFASDRLAFGRYRERGLEVVLVSGEESSVSDDAIVIGVGALSASGFYGAVVPGMSRDALVERWGEPDDEAGETDFYLEGFSVEYDGDAVLKVGVFRPYTHEPSPPPMQPASTRMEAR